MERIKRRDRTAVPCPTHVAWMVPMSMAGFHLCKKCRAIWWVPPDPPAPADEPPAGK